jgi:cell division protein FtsL
VPTRSRTADRTRRAPFLLFALTILTALVVGLVSAQTFVAQGSFRLQELSDQAERLEREFSRLRLRTGQLSSLDRIERAGKRSGLVYPDPEAYYLLTVPSRHAVADASDVAPGVEGAADVKAAMGAGG